MESKSLDSKDRVTWEQKETDQLLDLHNRLIHHVGPQQRFKCKKEMWSHIAHEIKKTHGLDVTGKQCEGKYHRKELPSNSEISNNSRSADDKIAATSDSSLVQPKGITFNIEKLGHKIQELNQQISRKMRKQQQRLEELMQENKQLQTYISEQLNKVHVSVYKNSEMNAFETQSAVQQNHEQQQQLLEKLEREMKEKSEKNFDILQLQLQNMQDSLAKEKNERREKRRERHYGNNPQTSHKSRHVTYRYNDKSHYTENIRNNPYPHSSRSSQYTPRDNIQSRSSGSTQVYQRETPLVQEFSQQSPRYPGNN